MKNYDSGCFIVIGITLEGDTFRPSDWNQRLCGMLSNFESGKLSYSSMVIPTHVENKPSVWVSGKLKMANEAVWNFILSFAKDNELKVEWPIVCEVPEK